MHRKYRPAGHMPMTGLKMRSSQENAQDWDEVVARMVDPRMTRFKAMSLDEQVETLEQSDQGALRAREEMIATETTEIPQAVLVQGRGFPMALDAQERGLFMLEQAQQDD
jgi:hypothetical protein